MDRDGTDKGTVPHEDADRLLALQELRDLGRIHDDTYDVEAARLVGARHTDDAPHKSAEGPTNPAAARRRLSFFGRFVNQQP